MAVLLQLYRCLLRGDLYRPLWLPKSSGSFWSYRLMKGLYKVFLYIYIYTYIRIYIYIEATLGRYVMERGGYWKASWVSPLCVLSTWGR